MVLHRQAFHAEEFFNASGYLKNDLKQLANPYVREITVNEVFYNRDLSYGEPIISDSQPFFLSEGTRPI